MPTEPAIVAALPSSGDYAALVPRLVELAGAGDLLRPGESVLIKPNLHTVADWRTGSVTNPALVAALIDWCRAQGAAEVLVADGPFYGLAQPERVFTETGMAEAVEAAGARWAVMNRCGWRTFRNVSPDLPDKIRLSELVFTHDRLIIVALAKTHLDCLVTLGMKNLKGCLHPDDKRAFHQEVDLNRALVALNRLVRPDLTFVDGTLGMEGMGPHAGTVANWGHIFAGREAAAVDAVVAPGMAMELEEVRTLRYAVEAGMVDPAGIEVRGERPAAFRRRFERPYEAMLRRLPGVRLSMAGACSACKLNLIRALCEEASQGVLPPRRCLVIGKSPADDEQALVLGKCAGAANPDRPHLAGCPPRLDKIKAYLKEHGGR